MCQPLRCLSLLNINKFASLYKTHFDELSNIERKIPLSSLDLMKQLMAIIVLININNLDGEMGMEGGEKGRGVTRSWW